MSSTKSTNAKNLFDFVAGPSYNRQNEERNMIDRYDAELEKGYALMTNKLLNATRNLLSAALPEDANDEMTQAFWEKVYDYL